MLFSEIAVGSSQWWEFAAAQPAATAFHHPAWVSLLAECYGYRAHVVVCQGEAGDIVAGLPMLQIPAGSSAPRWVSLPFTDSCDLLARDEQSRAAVISELLQAYREGRTAQVEIRASIGEADCVFQSQAGVCHRLPLQPDPDAVFARFKKTQTRQPIVQAERDGVTVRRGGSIVDLRSFYRMQVRTRRRLGMPVQPWRFFELLWSRLLEPGLGFLLLAEHQGAPIGGAVFLTWNGTLVYKFSASDSRFWGLRPNNLVLWTAIRWGCENGYHTFDFGRTDMEDVGLRRFKSGWGTVERPLVYSYIGGSPPSQRRGRLMRVLRPVIRHSPPIVCRLIGELFYKYAA